MNEHRRVHVNILDKEYNVACPINEEFALREAAKELDNRMRSIRSTGTIVGLERIAVMAALNLCNELLKLRSEEKEHASERIIKLNAISKRLDEVTG